MMSLAQDPQLLHCPATRAVPRLLLLPAGTGTAEMHTLLPTAALFQKCMRCS